jgi:hypothetical protein
MSTTATDTNVETMLRVAVEEFVPDPTEDPVVQNVMTFEDAGVMTHDKGLVLRTEDGREFQVTIVRSR